MFPQGKRWCHPLDWSTAFRSACRLEDLEPQKPNHFFMDGNGETPSVKGMNKSLRFIDFLDGVSKLFCNQSCYLQTKMCLETLQGTITYTTWRTRKIIDSKVPGLRGYVSCQEGDDVESSNYNHGNLRGPPPLCHVAPPGNSRPY